MGEVLRPSDKSPAIEDFLESNFGRSSAITELRCVAPPIGCGEVVKLDIDPEWTPEKRTFRDEASYNEYRISGMCQVCQNKVWG